MILAQDMNVKLVLLPEGEDPDSYLKKVGADAFSNYLADQAKDFILFKTELLMKEAEKDPIQKSIAVKSIIESISKIPDTLKRSLYIKQYSSILELDETILHKESNDFIKGENKKHRFNSFRGEAYKEENIPYREPFPPRNKTLQKESRDSDEHQEQSLIRVLINFGNEPYGTEENYLISDYIFENVTDILENIENPLYKKVILLSQVAKEEGKSLDQNYYINHSDEELQKLAVDLISSPYVYANWSGKGLELQTQKPPEQNHLLDAEQVVLRLRERKLRKLLQTTKTFINELDPNDQEKLVLYLKAFNKLETDHKALLQKLRTVVI
jgi:DNA primase